MYDRPPASDDAELEELLRVVDVHVRTGGRVVVHAAAKEGLIPQRTARKAVRKVIESLELAYRAAPPS